MARAGRLLPALFGCLAACLPVPARATESLVPAGATMRAVLVGIDDYRAAPHLTGAVADVRDLGGVLGRGGVTDVVVLSDRQAHRTAVLSALDGLLDRAHADDVALIALAGLGASVPEPLKGSRADGRDAAFLLQGFDASGGAGAGDMILDVELAHYVRQLEAKGARAVVVFDACAQAGTAREEDPRGERAAMRTLQPPQAALDDTRPAADEADAKAWPGPFARSAVLVACDGGSVAPEIAIPGIEGRRGALSYAVARALEGHGDADHDGRIDLDEFVGYVGQVAYELSAQRQRVLAVAPTGTSPRDAVVGLSRGIMVVPKGGQLPPSEPTSPPPLAAGPSSVRIATTGDASALANLGTGAVAVQQVSLRESPDLIWDPATGDVLAGADVIASRIPPGKLRGAVERTVAVRKLNGLSTLAPEHVRILPDDRLHRRGALVSVRIDAGPRKTIVVFNIAGDGTIQMLFPLSDDPRTVGMPFDLPPVRVQEPFGSDTVVVVTSEQSLKGLEQGLAALNGRVQPLAAAELVQRLLPPSSRVGLVSLFTSP